jgi:hypothetical protein
VEMTHEQRVVALGAAQQHLMLAGGDAAA